MEIGDNIGKRGNGGIKAGGVASRKGGATVIAAYKCFSRFLVVETGDTTTKRGNRSISIVITSNKGSGNNRGTTFLYLKSREKKDRGILITLIEEKVDTSSRKAGKKGGKVSY